MTENNRSTELLPLDRFLDDIRPTISAAEFCTMHYVGMRRKHGILVEKGRLRLYNVEGIVDRQYMAGNIVAGEFTLKSSKIDPIDAINSLVNGCLNTPHGKLILEPEANRQIRTEYDDMHSEGLQNQNRLSVMTLVGGSTYLEVEQPRVDWLLGASAQPYFSLQELTADFHCGSPLKSGATIEIIADNILFIDSQSIISDRIANLWVRMARQLDRSKVRLGYRLLLNGAVVDRSSVVGTDFEWEEREGILRGYVRIAVPDGSILQCFASYGGTARHYYWVTNPSTAQNPKRAIFELFDSNLNVFEEFLSRDHVRGRDARDFEFAISWLLWFLGFSVLNLPD